MNYTVHITKINRTYFPRMVYAPLFISFTSVCNTCTCTYYHKRKFISNPLHGYSLHTYTWMLIYPGMRTLCLFLISFTTWTHHEQWIFFSPHCLVTNFKTFIYMYYLASSTGISMHCYHIFTINVSGAFLSCFYLVFK